MKLGGEYRLRNIRLHHRRKMAEELRLDPDVLVRRVNDFASRLADHASAIGHRLLEEGLGNPIIARLADAVAPAPPLVRKSFGRREPSTVA